MMPTKILYRKLNNKFSQKNYEITENLAFFLFSLQSSMYLPYYGRIQKHQICTLLRLL